MTDIKDTLAALSEALAWTVEKCPNAPYVPVRKEDVEAILSGQLVPVPSVEEQARRVTDALWPILGGNHTDAETWDEISHAIIAAMKEGRDG